MRYSAARKTAATIVKQSWENFGQKLDTDYRSATKYFGKSYVVCAANKHQLPPADTNGVLLKHQKGIPNRWREYFCKLLNPVTVQHLKTSEKQIAEEIHLTEAEVSTAIKFLKAGKALEDDIRPEMLKAMNNFSVRWLTRVCQVAWKVDKVTKQWQTNVLIPIQKKGNKKCTNCRDISLLSLPEKIYAKCLKKRDAVK